MDPLAVNEDTEDKLLIAACIAYDQAMISQEDTENNLFIAACNAFDAGHAMRP